MSISALTSIAASPTPQQLQQQIAPAPTAPPASSSGTDTVTISSAGQKATGGDTDHDGDSH